MIVRLFEACCKSNEAFSLTADVAACKQGSYQPEGVIS